jgi:hemin uptake protein HemP
MKKQVLTPVANAHAAIKSRAKVEPENSLAVRRYCSQALLQGSLELEIEHNGALYRLRQTALGKLILTK